MTSDEINLITELSVTIQNKQLSDIPERVLGITILYVLHSCSIDECKVIFGALQSNNNNTYFINAVKSLTRFDLREVIPETELWILLKEQEDAINNIIIEITRIHNKVVLKSYEKYYNEFSLQYGFTYKSPNEDNKSGYGFFLTNIANDLNNEGVDFDLKHPWSKIYEIHQTKIHQKRFQELYAPTILTPKISNILKALMNSELKDKYYDLEVKYELKRFFLLGGITPDILLLDYVKYYGYEYLKNHMSESKWEEFSKDLDRYLNGANGIQNGWNHTYSAKYKEQDVYLIGLILENQYYHQNQKILEDKSRVEFFKRMGHNLEIERIKDIYHCPILYTAIDDFQVYEFIHDKEKYYEYIKSFAGPENEIRKLLGFNEIGEGWISETKLFYFIKERFKNFRVIQHGKPKWLGKQHLDIYIPELNIGIEYQ